MFRLDTDGTTILMHQGNTGTIRIHVTGYTFGNDDRVRFELRDGSGTILKWANCQVDQDGYIEIEFVNTDTDYLAPGDYPYGITAVTDPEYDTDETTIINGSSVYTPVELNAKVFRILGATAKV